MDIINIKRLLFIASVIVSIVLFTYGGFFNRHKIYEGSRSQVLETIFYDWFCENEIIVATTFGGIKRKHDGSLFSLSTYRQMQEDKRWKYCPS